MTDNLSPEEKDERASRRAKLESKGELVGKVDEFALKEAPSSTYIWLWSVIALVVLVALAGGALIGFLGGVATGRGSGDYEALLGAVIIDGDNAVYLAPVHVGQAAYAAGLDSGDELVSIDGERIDSAAQGQKIIAGHKVGDSVNLVIRRPSRAAQQYTVILGSSSAVRATATPEPVVVVVVTEVPNNNPQSQNLGEALLGLKYRMLLAEDSFDVAEGALVIFPYDGGPAYLAGLETGDIIVSINGILLTPNYTLEDALGTYEPGQRIEMQIIRDGEQITQAVTLGSE